MALTVATSLIESLRAEAARAAPHECCGLLLGGEGRIDAILPAGNVAREPRHRFEIDPAVLIAAHRAAREGGPKVIGCYHSHPDAAAIPSATDGAAAAPDGAIWLILGRDGVSGWRAVERGRLFDRFDPVPLHIAP